MNDYKITYVYLQNKLMAIGNLIAKSSMRLDVLGTLIEQMK